MHVYSIAVARQALTQRSRSHGYESRHGHTVASDHVRYSVHLCYLRPLPAWVCMSIRLPMFSVFKWPLSLNSMYFLPCLFFSDNDDNNTVLSSVETISRHRVSAMFES